MRLSLLAVADAARKWQAAGELRTAPAHQYICSGIAFPSGATITPQVSSAMSSTLLFRDGRPATLSEYWYLPGARSIAP
jgi:hypothetical protein